MGRSNIELVMGDFGLDNISILVMLNRNLVLHLLESDIPLETKLSYQRGHLVRIEVTDLRFLALCLDVP